MRDEKLVALIDIVRQDMSMMSVVNDDERSREVFGVILQEQGKKPDYEMLTRLMFRCGDSRCILDLVNFAVDQNHATRLASVFIDTEPAGHRNDWRHLVDFWDCDEASEAFTLLVSKLSPNMVQRWINTVFNNEGHWLLTIQATVDHNQYWSGQVRQYLERKRPDLKRAFEVMIKASKGFKIKGDDRGSEGRLLRVLYNLGHGHVSTTAIDEATLRGLVNQVFDAHVESDKIPADAADDLSTTDWYRRFLTVCQRSHDKIVAYKAWVEIPHYLLIARLSIQDPHYPGTPTSMTRESARLWALICYYQDLKLEKRHCQFVEEYGEPTVV